MDRNGFVAALKQELSRLEEERRTFDIKANTIKQLIRAYEGETQEPTPTNISRNRFASLKYADAAYLILKQNSAPLHVRDVVKAMAERGMRFNAKKPDASVVSSLMRDERFINKGRNTFALAEWEMREGESVAEVLIRNAPKPD